MKTKSRIEQAYEWYVAALAAEGIKHSLPPDTDVKKTYLWRSLGRWVKNSGELQEDVAKELMFETVKSAARKKIIDRASSALTSKKMLAQCYDRMIERRKRRSALIEEMRKSLSFFNQQLQSGVDPMTRRSAGAWPNVVVWYKSRQINPAFLALSRRMNSIMQELPQCDVSELPSIIQLNKLRIGLLMNGETVGICKEILGQDLVSIRVGGLHED